MRIHLFMLPLLLILPACTTLTGVREDFEQNSKEYNHMVRWHELDKACAIFPPEELSKDFAARVKAAKDVTVVDYRVLSMECEPAKGEAKVKAEIDYYLIPSTRVKTVQDNQKWSYVGEGDIKHWRLMTLLPEFK